MLYTLQEEFSLLAALVATKGHHILIFKGLYFKQVLGKGGEWLVTCIKSHTLDPRRGQA